MKIKPLLKYQLRTTITRNRINLMVLFLFFCIIAYLTISGIGNYEDFLKTKTEFVQYEKLKIQNYLNYEQYGAFGLNVLFHPSKLSVIFSDLNVFLIDSNVDVKAALKISSWYESHVVQKKPISVSSFLFYIGLTLSFIAGIISFPKELHRVIEKQRDFFAFVFTKLVILDLLWIVVFGFVYSLLSVSGIILSISELLLLCSAAIYLVLLFNLFTLLGIIIGKWKWREEYKFAIGFVIFLILVFALPEISKRRSGPSLLEPNMEKVLNLMKFEKRLYKELKGFKGTNRELMLTRKEKAIEYFKSVYQKNTQIENDRTDYYIKVALVQELNFLLPTGFYWIIDEGLSSKGIKSLIQFIAFLKEIREDFFKFYLSNNFKPQGEGIENFIKTDENIFYSRPLPPVHLGIGFLVLILYTLILALLLWRMTRPVRFSTRQFFDIKKLKEGEKYFYIDKGEDNAAIVEFLKSQGASVCKQVKDKILIPGSIPEDTIELLCGAFGYSYRKIEREIAEISKTWQTQMTSEERINLAVLLLHLQGNNFVVLEDILKGFEFENTDIISKFLMNTDNTILYISKGRFALKKEIKTQNIIPIDFRKVVIH